MYFKLLMSYIFYLILSPFQSCFGDGKSTQNSNYKKYEDLSPIQLQEIFHPQTVNNIKKHVVKTAHFVDIYGKSQIYRRCSTNIGIV